MNKIIGLITAWGAEAWICPALKQALEYCDEVIVTVAAHTSYLEKFKDKTYNICKEYSGIKLLTHKPSLKTVSAGRCQILNKMLGSSNLREAGNWVWMLDVDEFYTETAYKKIKEVIKNGKHDRVITEERFFLINMQHYLKGFHYRLFKIKDSTDKFIPTNKWSREATNTYILPRKDGMFHYSMLTDTRIHRVRWRAEYAGTEQSDKLLWLKNTYPYYDLNNEDRWISWFNDGMKPDENGNLFKYNGKHPKFIEEMGYPKIKDFRGLYQCS